MTVFHYRPGAGPLHRLDPRFKLILFLLLQTLVIGASWLTLACLALGLLVLAIRERCRLRDLLIPVPALWLGYGLTLLLRLFPWQAGDAAWLQGVLDGLRYMAGIVLMLAMSQLLLDSTRTHDLSTALLDLFARLPVRLAWGLTILCSVFFLLAPLLMDHLTERRMAMINRGGRTGFRSWRHLTRRMGTAAFAIIQDGVLLARDVELALRLRGLDHIPDQLDRSHRRTVFPQGALLLGHSFFLLVLLVLRLSLA